MCALFHSRTPEPPPALEPVPGEFPNIEGAEIAATTYGARVAGDFSASLRVSPERILFALLAVAGRRDTNRAVLTAATMIFGPMTAILSSNPDTHAPAALLT